ncbi:MAG TPA: hypothetical protein VIM68_05205 [Thermoanaerobaculia bacterium]|jgi:hypothetical protein
MVESIYDEIVALPRDDARRDEIAGALGCHQVSTAMLRILKINDPVEKERVTATVRAILEHEPRKKPAKTV